MTPIGAAEFAAALERLARFESPPFVAVAVSGGPDSLALVILAASWAWQRGGVAWALIVDHRLRLESSAEAERVAGWLMVRGIPHCVLVWDEPKPATGIQEAARTARYRLLAGWCRERGCLHLLTGHQRGDQTETHLIRLAAHSAADGLAGMPAIRELDGCRIVRPLLGFDKARLVATLEAQRQPFLRDPSNRDPAYARGRLRNRDGADCAGADRAAPPAAIGHLGRARLVAERAGDALAARTVALHPAGFASLDPALLQASPDVAGRVLSALVTTLGGLLYPPRRRQVARLRQVLCGDARGGCTLGGCRFVTWRDRLLVLRELDAAAAPVPVAAGASLVWDRRFAVVVDPRVGDGFSLGYLGRGSRTDPALRAALRRSALPPLAHAVLPVLRDAAGIAAIPHIGYRRAGVGDLPRLVFRPVKSLSGAGFAVV
ncbi:MAG TPA: tRNA lysidine(34) synthetase TilS [Stellaceae bacterium]|nr:tRNA lysidine(34) synthetase TilS [Stellaceae bacterium]